MSVNVIDTIKPKNGGSFPVVEAVDVSVSGGTRLDAALAAKANTSDLAGLASEINSKASQRDISELRVTMALKANQSSLDSTNAVLALKANQSSLDATNVLLAGKADKKDNDALIATLGTKADAETVNAEITNLQAQIDQIEIGASAEAVVAPEVVAARVGVDSTSYETLKQRLDTENTELSTNLATNETEIRERSCFAVGANYYNENTVMHGKDINSGTGAITDNVLYKVSDKIYIDPTRNMSVYNCAYAYLYCFGEDDTYYGRVPSSNNIAAVYPLTKYVRIAANETDTNIMVQYTADSTSYYVPYNPLGGLVKDEDLAALKDYVDGRNGDNGFVIPAYTEGNLFDNTKVKLDTDIRSNGTEYEAEGYFVTDFIPIDPTKRLMVNGSHAASDYNVSQYAYCFDSDKVYLGRVNCYNTAQISLYYETTAYIKAAGVTASDINSIMISYNGEREYKPYNPIIDYIKDYENNYGLASNVKKIKVLSFNTGAYDGAGLEVGSEETARAYRQVICDSDADIVATQEDVKYFDHDSVLPENSVYLTMKNNYRYGTGAYNFKALLSDYPMSNKSYVEYVNTAEYPMAHPFFLTSEINLGNAVVTAISVHLEWADKNNRKSQIEQIIAYAANKQNVLVIGDFNPEDYIEGVKQSNNLTYAADSALFTNAGYTQANAGLWGVINTIADPAEIQVGYTGPWDNVYVKGNMLIKNVYTIQKDWMNDHFPIVAEILVY